MNDQQPDLGNLIKPFVHSMGTKATTALAAFLLTEAPSGLLTSDQAANIASAVVGFGLLIGSVAWSWLKVKLNAKKLVAAAATGNPQASPSAPLTQAAVSAAINDPASPITAKAA